MAEDTFQQIHEIGFKRLIDKFKTHTGTEHPAVRRGIGDDASVIVHEEASAICTTTEVFLEGVHFDLTYTPFNYLGYKIVTAAVSDILAMNALPEQVLIGLAIPNKYSVQMMEDLYRGVDAACRDYGIQLTGGDTTASHQLLSVSVTATGAAPADKLIYRDGAQLGDIVCVTGDLGSALAGLRVLMREKKAWQESRSESQFQPDLHEYEFAVQKQLVPKARKDLIESIAESDIRPTSLIDVTQGLISELGSVAKSSGLGMEVYSPAVPIALETRRIADEMNEDVDKYAFYGGEDFEMVFTIPEESVEKFKSDFDDFVVIGRMTEKEKQLTINTGEDKSYQLEL
ncbi:thiamine-phosphate kinase [Rhodohalobacter mucosus]|uniref:Thiamine-monophosphate kinase n=1 Tax=Rhodohalobacter mucosus TaxID=2079485 RepID=A0A316TQD8_9BACT|nr:thiamine-phosphate kinase [Rhodohalobacter mucosus]PWN06833.1 thiamine-phosphate kinase [Rhodohalobacter mucosus]